jgi:uncharacterized membrane protein YphA (DoxX/SURF4 family)
LIELAVVARFVLAAVFLTAGVAKVSRRTEFADAVRNYDLVPERLSLVIGRLLPAVEVLLGAMLFAGIALPEAAAVTGVALLTFSAAIVVNLLRGREIDCGCFGLIAEPTLGWTSVIRNLVLVTVTGLVVWHPAPTLSIYPSGLASMSSIPNGTGVAGLILGTIVTLTFSLIRETRRLRRLLRRYA